MMKMATCTKLWHILQTLGSLFFHSCQKIQKISIKFYTISWVWHKKFHQNWMSYEWVTNFWSCGTKNEIGMIKRKWNKKINYWNGKMVNSASLVQNAAHHLMWWRVLIGQSRRETSFEIGKALGRIKQAWNRVLQQNKSRKFKNTKNIKSSQKFTSL